MFLKMVLMCPKKLPIHFGDGDHIETKYNRENWTETSETVDFQNWSLPFFPFPSNAYTFVIVLSITFT